MDTATLKTKKEASQLLKSLFHLSIEEETSEIVKELHDWSYAKPVSLFNNPDERQKFSEESLATWENLETHWALKKLGENLFESQLEFVE